MEIKGIVRQIDVLPTLLTILDIPYDKNSFDGEYIDEKDIKTIADRPQYFYLHSQFMTSKRRPCSTWRTTFSKTTI